MHMLFVIFKKFFCWDLFYFVILIECLMNNLFVAYFIIYLFSLVFHLNACIWEKMFIISCQVLHLFSYFIAYNNFSLDVILTNINYPLLRSFHTIRKCLCCKIRILCYPGEAMEPVFIPT